MESMFLNRLMETSYKYYSDIFDNYAHLSPFRSNSMLFGRKMDYTQHLQTTIPHHQQSFHQKRTTIFQP